MRLCATHNGRSAHTTSALKTECQVTWCAELEYFSQAYK